MNGPRMRSMFPARSDHPPHPARPAAAPRNTRLRLVALVGAAVVLFAACGPDVESAPAAPGSPEAIIREVFTPLGEADKAVRVASCESGLNPMAVSSGGTYQGLFQLGSNVVAIQAYGGDRLDAWANASAARDLRVQRGNWSAWPICGRR